jgi:hypothetical protein
LLLLSRSISANLALKCTTGTKVIFPEIFYELIMNSEEQFSSELLAWCPQRQKDWCRVISGSTGRVSLCRVNLEGREMNPKISRLRSLRRAMIISNPHLTDSAPRISAEKHKRNPSDKPSTSNLCHKHVKSCFSMFWRIDTIQILRIPSKLQEY